jgi:hypothetical protein
MRRPFVISSFALALALAPAVLFAQAPAPAQPPAGQTPPAAAQPAAPAPPKLALTSPAGALLVPIKPGETAVFEEFVGKLKAGLAKTSDPTLKQQAAGFKIYKAAEPFGTNALYVVTIEPVVPNADYELFDMLRRTMTPEELRAPEAAEMWKRYANAFASGPSRLSLTTVGGQ